MNTRPELTYDGHGINGPDEYRSRVVNFQTQADADKYGKLLAAGPDLLAALEASTIALQDFQREAGGICTHPKLDWQIVENLEVLNKAKGATA